MYLRIVIAFLFTFTASITAFAQQAASYSVPRTEYGHPDFQGVWMLDFLTPLERPDGVQNLILSSKILKFIFFICFTENCLKYHL